MNRLFSAFVLCVAMLAAPPSSTALAPHEILLVVNASSPDSCTVANHYIDKREIPSLNVLYLDLPADLGGSITEEQFSSLILAPIKEAMTVRGLTGQACMAVFSTDFPYRVTTTPATSLHGMMVANTGGRTTPKAEDIKRGLWRAPFFAGPDGPDQPQGETLSMIRFSGLLKTNMALSACSLGYSGERGNDLPEILACIDRGIAADYTRPADPVVVVTNQGVRSTSRSWQFEPVVKALRASGHDASIVGDFKTQRYGDIMMGFPMVDLSRCTFPPGAIADNLTSFGASFDQAVQTKVSAWIRQGATMSCGTVTEPFAIWTKFPHARVFEHVRAGASLGEAMWLSVRCPMQTYFLGEPLSRPHADKLNFQAELEITDDLVHFRVQNMPADADWVLLLDGRLVSGRIAADRISIPRLRVWPGSHIATIFMFRDGRVRQFTQQNLPFHVEDETEWAKVELNADGDFTLSAAGDAPVRLMQGFREIGKGPVVSMSPAIGKGPVTVEAEAEFNGRKVRSAPLRVMVE